MSGKAIRDTVAAIGVIASLLFVGVEIRQNTTAARAGTRQALAETSVSLIMALIEDPEMNRDFLTWMSAPDDATLDCMETRMCSWAFALARHHENVFLQVLEGVVDTTAFASYGYKNNGTYQSPLFAQYWPRVRSTFHPDFVAELERLYDLQP